MQHGHRPIRGMHFKEHRARPGGKRQNSSSNRSRVLSLNESVSSRTPKSRAPLLCVPRGPSNRPRFLQRKSELPAFFDLLREPSAKAAFPASTRSPASQSFREKASNSCTPGHVLDGVNRPSRTFARAHRAHSHDPGPLLRLLFRCAWPSISASETVFSSCRAGGVFRQWVARKRRSPALRIRWPAALLRSRARNSRISNATGAGAAAVPNRPCWPDSRAPRGRAAALSPASSTDASMLSRRAQRIHRRRT